MAIRIVCDRCGKDIEGTTYYTIDIYAKDAGTAYGVSAEVAMHNLAMNTRNMFGTVSHYCKRCIEDIESYIRNKPDEGEQER